ncbi:hypothetical protein WI92_25130 [Burkholderia vietnamiensis]|uniref:hypothetical protein n=1 Tax=Burkholderia vietnamiensis TaxID=60552 RepID=UPI000751B63D|nr:hypothetical protein [Burkholderia vietnamiensis]KVE21249.1 hypothetical protein WI92_25130 [Burkholderia vietnamiensis]
MGYLRKRSFLIFSDPDAPTEVATLDAEKVAQIEAAHERSKAERIENLISQNKEADPGVEARLREVVRNVQEAGADENALKEYINTTFRYTNEQPWRQFAWAVHEIVISKAAFPDNRYTPSRSSERTVRFRQDGYLGVDVEALGTSYNKDTMQRELDGSQNPSLWVKVVDGWAKDGNWGGYLQISCVTQKGKYIDSSNGWVKPVTNKEDKVTFYDMGNYYEIWQGDRESGRPLIISDKCLRFVAGATPAKWNLQDSTWD